jgi:hypothetical protein
MQQSKYGNKSKFSREKHYVCSEADINRIDNKQNQWNEKRKEERNHNLKMASGVEVAEPKPEEKKRQPRSEYIIDYAEDVEEEIEYFPKMHLIMHDIPLSFNIDNVLRSFMYYGDIAYVKSVSNHTSPTYDVTAVPNEWNENIAEIQADIAEKGFAMIGDYKVTSLNET